MDRDHGRTRATERQRVLRVHERGTELPQQTRQREGHPELLDARGELHGLDSLGHEVGAPRHGGNSDPGRSGERGKLAEEVANVGLVTGPPAAEDVGVDDDERRAHPMARSYEATAASAARAQVKSRARSSPSATSSARVREASIDAVGDRSWVERVDEDGGRAGDVGHGAVPARDHRRPAGHRLRHRDPEPLVERRIDEAAGAAVELRELQVGDAPQPADAVPSGLDAAPASSPDDPELDAGEPSCLDRSWEVLARLERADSQDVVSGCTRSLGHEDRIDGVRHHVDAIGIDVTQLGRLASGELGDGDNPVRRANRAPQAGAAIQARPRRERLRVPQHGEVVHGDEDGDARAQRCAVDRAVKHVEPCRMHLPGQQQRVPDDVAH